jgi:hypothetical protein
MMARCCGCDVREERAEEPTPATKAAWARAPAITDPRKWPPEQPSLPEAELASSAECARRRFLLPATVPGGDSGPTVAAGASRATAAVADISPGRHPPREPAQCPAPTPARLNALVPVARVPNAAPEPSGQAAATRKAAPPGLFQLPPRPAAPAETPAMGPRAVGERGDPRPLSASFGLALMLTTSAAAAAMPSPPRSCGSARSILTRVRRRAWFPAGARIAPAWNFPSTQTRVKSSRAVRNRLLV